jgi:hypothetical protein
MPNTEDRAGVGLQQAGHHAQGRGLAGAVGPEQRVELAGADGEVQSIDGRAIEALDQAADFEREGRTPWRLPIQGDAGGIP